VALRLQTAGTVVAHAMASTSDVLDALSRAGFTVKERTAGFYVLERGYRVVVVPDAPQLSSGQLETVLAAAEISAESFDSLLTGARATRSGMFKKI
jgi:hypothetical protein